MNQPSRDQLILLHSLLELNESATADTIWANIQFHNTLQAAMPSADFNQALDALLSAGILVRPSARGDLLEFEYAAYEHFLHLCATGPQDNISAAGQRRIEEAASFVRMFLSGEGEEIAQEVRDRQNGRKAGPGTAHRKRKSPASWHPLRHPLGRTGDQARQAQSLRHPAR